jgi:hypothetical protein
MSKDKYSKINGFQYTTLFVVSTVRINNRIGKASTGLIKPFAENVTLHHYLIVGPLSHSPGGILLLTEKVALFSSGQGESRGGGLI